MQIPIHLFINKKNKKIEKIICIINIGRRIYYVDRITSDDYWVGEAISHFQQQQKMSKNSIDKINLYKLKRYKLKTNIEKKFN